jgi:hypothetical protein
MCVAHDARLTSARSYISKHAYVHTDIPNANTCACLARIPSFIPGHNVIIHTATTRHLYEHAMYCTYSSVWSVELRESNAPMCFAPPAPMELLEILYAHACVRIPIQRTCVAHDARSTNTRLYIRMHDIPNTNTRTYHTLYYYTLMQTGYVLYLPESLE